MLISYDELTAYQKVVIILNEFPTEAPNIIKELSEEDRNSIFFEMGHFTDVSKETINKVIKEFSSYLESNKEVRQGGVENLKKLLLQVYGREEGNKKIEEVLTKLTSIISPEPLEVLRKMDSPIILANILQEAEPQITAAILCYLKDKKKISIILESMKPEYINRIIEGIASIGENGLSDEVINNLDQFLREKISGFSHKDKINKVGGVETATQIMNNLDSVTGKDVMEKISSRNPDLALEISKKMFIFEDLLDLEDIAIQKILAEDITEKEIAICLRYCNSEKREEINEKFMRNMSKRRAQSVKDTLDNLKNIKTKELDEAEQKIISIAKSLADREVIVLNADSDEYLK